MYYERVKLKGFLFGMEVKIWMKFLNDLEFICLVFDDWNCVDIGRYKR